MKQCGRCRCVWGLGRCGGIWQCVWGCVWVGVGFVRVLVGVVVCGGVDEYGPLWSFFVGCGFVRCVCGGVYGSVCEGGSVCWGVWFMGSVEFVSGECPCHTLFSMVHSPCCQRQQQVQGISGAYGPLQAEPHIGTQLQLHPWRLHVAARSWPTLLPHAPHKSHISYNPPTQSHTHIPLQTAHTSTSQDSGTATCHWGTLPAAVHKHPKDLLPIAAMSCVPLVFSPACSRGMQKP